MQLRIASKASGEDSSRDTRQTPLEPSLLSKQIPHPKQQSHTELFNITNSELSPHKYYTKHMVLFFFQLYNSTHSKAFVQTKSSAELFPVFLMDILPRTILATHFHLIQFHLKDTYLTPKYIKIIHFPDFMGGGKKYFPSISKSKCYF